MTTQQDPQVLTELKMNADIQRTINEAYVPNDNPIIMASIGSDGKPVMSYRGSVIAFSETQLGVWARNAEGGTAKALVAHPDVQLIYRESGGPGQRSKGVMTFRGKARVDNDEATRTKVYETMPQRERDSDPEMKGVAIIVDLESLTGFIPGYRLQMSK